MQSERDGKVHTLYTHTLYIYINENKKTKQYLQSTRVR